MLFLEKIYKTYTQDRKIKWTIEHFTLLVEFFPAILVLNSDGLFDKKEAKYVDRLVDNVGLFLEDEGFSPAKIQSLKAEFKTELLYLGNQSEAWKKPLLEALKEYLNVYPEQKPAINDAMSLFAKISEGISDTEQQTINDLKILLELQNL